MKHSGRFTSFICKPLRSFIQYFSGEGFILPRKDSLCLRHIPYEVVNHPNLLLHLTVVHHTVVDENLFDERRDDLRRQRLDVRELLKKPLTPLIWLEICPTHQVIRRSAGQAE